METTIWGLGFRVWGHFFQGCFCRLLRLGGFEVSWIGLFVKKMLLCDKSFAQTCFLHPDSPFRLMCSSFPGTSSIEGTDPATVNVKDVSGL